MLYSRFRLLIFVCFLSVFCYAQKPVQPLPTIALKKTIEGSLTNGEAQPFALHLESDQFAELILEQFDTNAAIELQDAATGNLLLTVDANPHNFGSERAFFYNQSASRDISVRVFSPEKTDGKFALTLVELKKNDKRDNLRLAAQKTILEGQKIYAADKLEAKEKGRAAFENALDVARQSGDPVLEKDVLILLQESYLDSLGRDKGKSAGYGKAAFILLADHKTGYDYARVQSNLGSAFVEMGELSQGVEALSESLAAARRFGDESMEMSNLQNLGSAYQRLGDLEKCLDYSEQALQTAKKRGDVNIQTEVLKVVSRVYNARGDFPKAIETLNEALNILNDSDQNSKFTIYNDLATNFIFLGQLQKSNDYLQKSLGYYREISGNKWNEAATLQSIAMNYSALGQTERAVEYTQRASDLYTQLGYRDALIGVARTKAVIYRNVKDYQKEKQYYAEALKLTAASGDKVLTAEMYKSLGGVEKRLGNYAVALEYYLKATQLNSQAENKSLQSANGIAVSDLYFFLGNFDKAAEFAEKSLTTAQKIGDRITESNALYNLARVRHSQKNLKEALRLGESSLKIIEAVRSDLISQESRRAYFSTVREKYDFYIELLVELQAESGDGETAAAAYAMSEKARARGLLDLLTESYVDISSGINPDLKVREQNIQAKISSLQTQLIRLRSKETPNAAQVAELQKALNKTDDEREQLESEIRRTNPRYAALKYPTTLDLKQTQNLLDEKTVFLEYQTGKNASFLFAVTKHDFRIVRLPDEQKLRETVEMLRRSISVPTRTGLANYLLEGRELYHTLLAPVENLLRDKSNLIISGDGALNYLPFEVLLTAGTENSLDKLPYLVRNYEISYVPSASVLASLNPAAENMAAKPKKSFLAFAAPDYGTKTSAPEVAVKRLTHSVSGDNRGWDLSDLKNAGIEATRIAKLFPVGQSEVFSGAAATEERAKSNELLSNYRYIHFAVHGLMDEIQPQFSSLVLTLPKASEQSKIQEDGLLQTPEIFDLRLRADLVTLSACETGLGKEMRGEGIVGLTRAFFYAGTPSVLVSLWNVDDASTAELMTNFYEQLRKDDGRNKAAALREAQLKMIAGNRYAHPYYWAAFVLQGKSGSIFE